MTIHKYPLSITHKQEIAIQENAIPLDIQLQGVAPCLWCMVDPDAKEIRRDIVMYGTGYDMLDEKYIYLGTVQTGNFMWHYFWIVEEEK